MINYGKILIFCVGLFLFLKSPAQINLVPNPSFEDLTECPTSGSQLGYSISWFQPYTNSNGLQQSSTDLYSSCCSGFCGLINNVKGSQLPRTGNSYAGISLYIGSATYREYIEAKLNDSLIDNKSYCIKFYVSLADKCKYATSNFGVYFSNDSCLHIIPPDTAIPYSAQVLNSSSNIIVDKNNWIPIELAYTAQGGENFITVGGFNPNNVIAIGSGTINQAYYYIDDVSVIDINTPAYSGVDTTIAVGDSVFIGRTPEIGLNEDCIWYVNNIPIDTIAGMWVQPDSTTTYVLEQSICGTTTYDTVTVTVQPTGIAPSPSERAGVRLYPNPSNGDLYIKLEYGLTDQSTVIIYDIAGKEVLRQVIRSSHTSIDIRKIKEGIYIYQVLKNGTEKFYGKLVVE
jgi:hypothetical protein